MSFNVLKNRLVKEPYNSCVSIVEHSGLLYLSLDTKKFDTVEIRTKAFRELLDAGACILGSCPVLSYPNRIYPILSYSVLSYSILSYPVLSYPILSYPVLSCPILSYPQRTSFF